MALPTPVKTWQYTVNQTLGPYANFTLQQQSLLFALKQSLVGFASSPWTVVSSCDSVSTSASDLWAAATNLVWSTQGDTGTVRSWIILKQTGVASNFQVLICCQSNGQLPAEHALLIAISPNAGFTGGSTTTRPSATDEQVLIVGSSGTSNGNWVSPTSTVQANRFVLHVTQSTDGSITRFQYWINSRHMNYVTFGKVADAPTASPVVYWGGTFPNTSGGLDDNSKATYAKWNDTARLNVYYNATAYSAAGVCTSEGFITSMVGEQLTVANEIDSTWPISVMGVASTTVGLRGRLGRIPDCWWTSTGLADADTFPGDSSNQFVKFGHMVFPWNGSTPLVA